jgi:hypothetical protein
VGMQREPPHKFLKILGPSNFYLYRSTAKQKIHYQMRQNCSHKLQKQFWFHGESRHCLFLRKQFFLCKDYITPKQYYSLVEHGE